MRMRTVLVAGVAIILVGVAALGFFGGEPDTSTIGTTPLSAATVAKTTLIQTEKVSGTLSYGTPKPATSAATGTVTWVPEPGTIIGLGDPVYKVDNKPVVLMQGALPAYRTLQGDMSGADVVEFEKSLAKLGYKGFTVDSHYNWDTAVAVIQWQEDLGMPQTGTVSPSDILVAPADIRIALIGVGAGGKIPGDTQTILTFSGTTQVVTVALDVAKQHLVKKGQKTTVILPDGKSVAGTVSAVSQVATTNETTESPTTTITFIVSIADQKALGTFDAAPVDVTLVTDQREGVLAVPVSALVAIPGGGYGVQVIKGSESTVVKVKTGLFANGKVEISGDGIAEGTAVGVPS